MPLTTLDARRFLVSYTEELANTPKPFFGTNIMDMPIEKLPEFEERLREFGEEGFPIVDCLGCVPYHRSIRDYGNGRIRMLGMWYYENAFDVEEYKRLTDDNPQFHKNLLALFDLLDDYQWFTTSEIPEPEA